MLTINLKNFNMPVQIIYSENFHATQLVSMDTAIAQQFQTPYFPHLTSTPYTNYNDILSCASMPQILTNSAAQIYDVSQIPLPEVNGTNLGDGNGIDSAANQNPLRTQAECFTPAKHHISGKKCASDNFNYLYRKIVSKQRIRREKEIA